MADAVVARFARMINDKWRMINGDGWRERDIFAMFVIEKTRGVWEEF